MKVKIKDEIWEQINSGNGDVNIPHEWPGPSFSPTIRYSHLFIKSQVLEVKNSDHANHYEFKDNNDARWFLYKGHVDLYEVWKLPKELFEI